MRQAQRHIVVPTRGRGLYDITAEVVRSVEASGVKLGLATIFITHTSASLLVQENADEEVRNDLERFFVRLVPDGDPLFRHTEEGPDDMPAHVRAALTQTSLGLPIQEGRLCLGTWQGVYVFEHRHRSHERVIIVHVVGE
jgi:secondary thiamine-phosphate synthase enzyme